MLAQCFPHRHRGAPLVFYLPIRSPYRRQRAVLQAIHPLDPRHAID